MRVTVCVCTHNRPGHLAACLDGLRRQTAEAEGVEILVVDSASTAEAAEQISRLVQEVANARLLRVERAGVSLARNAGVAAATGDYVAFIDDDAIAEPDWVARILAAVAESHSPPAVLGGRILPIWEVPLPAWWPARLRGLLSIIEVEGQGEYRTAALPVGLEPCCANMVLKVSAARAVGGFSQQVGRVGQRLLSDEEVQLTWRLQDAGYSTRYDSRIVVHHQIQAARLTPRWLISRLYWQGISAVRTRRLLGHPEAVWRELPRRLALAALLAPSALLPSSSTRLLSFRWRLAYAAGFVRAALAAGG